MVPARGSSLLISGAAVLGGVVFVVALGFGVFVYIRWFGAESASWSVGAGLPAVAVNSVLFTAFALHHSVFARWRVKAWVSGVVSPALERTTYVVIASALFCGLLWFWTPVPGVAWRAEGAAALGLRAVQLAGVFLTAHAARMLGVLALAGVATVSPRSVDGDAQDAHPPALRRTGVYGWVRHPIYLAWLLMVWFTPHMTGSRLLFATLSTLYLAIAVPFEERTLSREFGSAYDTYKRAVKWRMVPFVY